MTVTLLGPVVLLQDQCPVRVPNGSQQGVQGLHPCKQGRCQREMIDRQTDNSYIIVRLNRDEDDLHSVFSVLQVWFWKFGHYQLLVVPVMSCCSSVFVFFF